MHTHTFFLFSVKLGLACLACRHCTASPRQTFLLWRRHPAPFRSSLSLGSLALAWLWLSSWAPVSHRFHFAWAVPSFFSMALHPLALIVSALVSTIILTNLVRLHLSSPTFRTVLISTRLHRLTTLCKSFFYALAPARAHVTFTASRLGRPALLCQAENNGLALASQCGLIQAGDPVGLTDRSGGKQPVDCAPIPLTKTLASCTGMALSASSNGHAVVCTSNR